MLSGVFSSTNMGRAISRLTAVNRIPMAVHSITDMVTACLSPCRSPAPNFWVTRMAKPWVIA